ncbi:MAG: diaminopimelate epimerase [Armatimonas sp.]
MTVRFTKMHGIGNDFVVVDGLVPDAPTPTQVQPHLEAIGHRRFGVGYDQFLFVQPSEVADFAMPIYNPDGSEAEMCGNGIRAFAKYVYDHGYTDKTNITVDTLAGIKTLDLDVQGGKVASVTVDMGTPGLDRSDIGMIGEAGQVINEPLEVNHEVVRITGVSMGNPHVVFFADEVTEAGHKLHRPGLREPPPLPSPHQRPLSAGTRTYRVENPDLGARRRPHPGLRHRRVCVPCCCPRKRLHRPLRPLPLAWWRPQDTLGRRNRPCLYDWPCHRSLHRRNHSVDAPTFEQGSLYSRTALLRRFSSRTISRESASRRR